MVRPNSRLARWRWQVLIDERGNQWLNEHQSCCFNRLMDLGDPVEDKDAATKEYVDSRVIRQNGIALCNLNGGATSPTEENDEDDGYSIGSKWYNDTTIFECMDATAHNAVWVQIWPLLPEALSITNSMLAGSIAFSKLLGSDISITNSQLAGSIAFSKLLGSDISITNSQLAGSISQDKLAGGILNSQLAAADGWIAAPALTYASADAPTYTVTCSGNYSTTIMPGMRMKMTQSGSVKYFIVTKVSYSSPNTTITLYGGTDYTLGSTITLPYYSMVKAPAGFPMNPAKWTVTVTDSTQRTQSTPTNNTYYNIGGANCQLSLPIGAWYLSYVVFLVGGLASGVGYDTMQTALSTASNSATIAAAVRAMQMPIAQLGPQFIPACSGVPYSVTSKTLLYLLGLINSDKACSDLSFRNDWMQMVITAECAYL